MVIDDKEHFILSANRRSLIEIAKLFNLTSDEIDHPSCGLWIADCIKQLQTAQLALKSMALRQHNNTKVETYETDPFLQKPNPLLITEATTS